MSITAKPRRIILIGFEGIQLLDLAGPADVFSIANARAGKHYELIYVGTKKSITSSNGLSIQLKKLPRIKRLDTLIIPGGMGQSIRSAIADEELMLWLKKASSRAHRIVSICSGAFVLAHLGLLNNRQVVTHWAALDFLATKAPLAKIKRDAIFVEDGNVWTSAGVTTGIDLALAIIRKDISNYTALQVARDLVVQVIRPGNQSQYSAPLSLQRYADKNLEKLIPWLESRIAKTTPVSDMALTLGLSERQFHRQCVSQFGRTPAKLLLHIKLDHARSFLQDQDIPISNISQMCGFSGSTSFSKAFKKQFSISPTMYRQNWTIQDQKNND